MKDKIYFFFNNPIRLITALITRLPYFQFIRKTTDYQCSINLSFWFIQKILNLGGNRQVYWPVHHTSKVVGHKKILIGIDTNPGFMNGCYIQGIGGISIGNYTQIGPNVVIVSANHDIHDSRKHIESPVKIGAYCWIGAGAKIMPGVELGNWTIVGAGAVVTKSFIDGCVILAGVPAKIVKKINIEKCIPFENKEKYYGYLSEMEFEQYKKNNMNLEWL